MGRGHYQVLNKIVIPGGDSRYSLSPSLLGPVGIRGNPLNISQMGKGYCHILFFHQILFIQLSFITDDLGAALVAVFLFNLQELVFNNSHQQLLVVQQGVVVVDFLHELIVFRVDFFSLQALESSQLHVQNSLGLNIRKTESLHQSFFGIVI